MKLSATSTRWKPDQVLDLCKAPPQPRQEELPLSISKEQEKKRTRYKSREVE
jgi:hypothetical protein